MTMTNAFLSINGYNLTNRDVINAATHNNVVAVLDPVAEAACAASRKQVDLWLQTDAPVVYGVNTGLGNLKDTMLSPSEHIAWNSTIPYPHAVGMGNFINPIITRTALLIRANVLSRSYSGVRPALIHRILEVFNAGISPTIRELGSTGLSDLGPMAHCAMVVSGMEGARVFYKDRLISASECFEMAGLATTFTLECKEVLSMMNGSTMTQAAAVHCIQAAQALLKYQDELLALSTLQNPELGVVGDLNIAISRTLLKITQTIEFENNVSCDNPLLFQNGLSYDVAMGCNCSNTQVGYDLDLLCIILSDKAALAVEFVKSYYTCEGNEEWLAIASNAAWHIHQNAQSASVDSIPTKAGQEDHVEFSYGAVRKAFSSVEHYKTLMACLLILLTKDHRQEQSVLADAALSKMIRAEDNRVGTEQTLRTVSHHLDTTLSIVSFTI